MKKKEACAACGLPLKLKDNLVWTVGGNIFFDSKPRYEVILFDHRELGFLVDQAVARGGNELLTGLKDARRRYVRDRTLQQMGGLRPRLLRSRLFRKRAVKWWLGEAALYGLGRLTINEIDLPDKLELEVSHPYHPDLFAADIAGFWEGFFRVEASYRLEHKEQQAWTLSIETGEKRKYTENERKAIPENHPGKKDKGLEKCGKCGLPAGLAHLRWDNENGTIYDPVSYRYLAVLEVAGLKQLVREMRTRLASDYPAAARAAFADSMRSNGQPKTAEPLRSCREMFEAWPVLGWGGVGEVVSRPFMDEITLASPAIPSFQEQKIAACWQLAVNEAVSTDGVALEEGGYRVSVGPQLSEYSINVATLCSRFPQITHYPQSLLPF